MKRLILLVLLLTTVLLLFATKQEKDLVKYNNHTFYINQVPLEYYFGEEPRHRGFDDWCSTGCVRGYKGVWLIKNNKLYLKKIAKCGCLAEVNKFNSEVMEELSRCLPKAIFDKLSKLNRKKYKSSRRYNYGSLYVQLELLLGEEDYRRYSDVIYLVSSEHKKKVSLRKIFGDSCESDLVFAKWYSGHLSLNATEGALFAEDINKYQRSNKIRFIIENGEIIKEVDYYTGIEIKYEDYKRIRTSTFSLQCSSELGIKNRTLPSSAFGQLQISNSDSSISIYSKSFFHQNIINSENQLRFIAKQLKLLSGTDSVGFVSEISNYSIGVGGWQELLVSDTHKYIFVLTTAKEYIVIEYATPENRNDAIEEAKSIFNSVIFVRFR